MIIFPNIYCSEQLKNWRICTEYLTTTSIILSYWFPPAGSKTDPLFDLEQMNSLVEKQSNVSRLSIIFQITQSKCNNAYCIFHEIDTLESREKETEKKKKKPGKDGRYATHTYRLSFPCTHKRPLRSLPVSSSERADCLIVTSWREGKKQQSQQALPVMRGQ